MALVCVAFVASVGYWNFASDLLALYRYSPVVNQMLWLATAAIHPLIYLTLNKCAVLFARQTKNNETILFLQNNSIAGDPDCDEVQGVVQTTSGQGVQGEIDVGDRVIDAANGC